LDRVQRLETSVHQKVSRAELIGWAWAVVPLVVGAALLISLIVSNRPHAS
jgi:hypothetical protein